MTDGLAVQRQDTEFHLRGSILRQPVLFKGNYNCPSGKATNQEPDRRVAINGAGDLENMGRNLICLNDAN